MTLKSLKEEVWEMNLELKNNNLVTMTSGNVSGRDRKSQYVVIKPSGVKYSSMKPEDMVVVDLDGKVIKGRLKSSIDTISHLIVYRAFKEVGGIVHTHSNYATSFALLGQPLPVYMSAHADEFGEEIPVTRYASPFPLEDVGNAIVETLHESLVQAVLLKNHGVFAFGSNATSALKSAVMVEDIAKTYHLALFLGRPKKLSKKEVKKWYTRYYEVYGQRK